jgi:putative methyltransferase (TIGR04325 family)
MRFRRVLQLLLPGFVPELIDRLRPAERAYFGPRWPTETREVGNDQWTEKVMRLNWPVVEAKISGIEPLDMLPYKADQADLTAHNVLMTSLYVLGRAAHHRDGLSVLDWGGGLGLYARVARRLLPEVAFDYVVKELPVNCRLGAELNPSVTFVASDDVCFSRSYDVVMANGSMHYVEDWKAIASLLAAAASSWLLVTCVPVVRRVPGYIAVQRLRSLGHDGDFFSNVINRDELVEHIGRHGFTLERELMSWGTVSYKGAPEDASGAGFLFRRNTAS